MKFIYDENHGKWVKDWKFTVNIDLAEARAILELTLAEYAAVRSNYYHAIYDAVDGYLVSKSASAKYQKDMENAITRDYELTATIGWADGGGKITGAVVIAGLMKNRIDAEIGFAGALFERLKILRSQLAQDTPSDAGLIVVREGNARAEGYAKSLDYFYAVIKLMALGDESLMFGGFSGQESCPECEKLMNTWHPASWYVANGYVPPRGENLTCRDGGHCEHVLMNKQGMLVTI